jgi:hypothetical protein
MRLSCQDIATYLRGDLCRRIAGLLAHDIPGVEADDVFNTAYANFLANRQRNCKAWDDCPLQHGEAQQPCPVAETEAYAKQIVRNAARRLRRAEVPQPEWSTPEQQQQALAAAVDGAPPVADVGAQVVRLARLDACALRLATEPVRAVFPGIHNVRVAVKVDAARVLLQGRTYDVGEALRMVAPAIYEHQRVRTHRDGLDVKLICQAVL